MLNAAYPIAERKAMHTRLKKLEGRWLLAEEAKQLEEVAEALNVSLRWKRHHFLGGQQIARGDTQSQVEQPAQSALWTLTEPEPPYGVDYAQRRRHPGCQSNNHTHCFGDLWTCGCCDKVVCENEGFAGDDLCDDCWMLKRRLDEAAAIAIALMGPETYAHFRRIAEGAAHV